MCFIEKMNCIRIREREDGVMDPVRTLGRVKLGTGARAPDRSFLEGSIHINNKLTLIYHMGRIWSVLPKHGDMKYRMNT